MEWTAAIVQQPKLARMSGINESKSRRILDPPLVVYLDCKSDNFIAKTNLFTETDQNADYLVDPTTDTRISNLNGSVITTPRLLFDSPSRTRKKLFFVFSKLSIRQAGRYYLTCTIAQKNQQDTITLKSEVFEVFPPHAYPGNSG
jgi:hypothetical protein